MNKNECCNHDCNQGRDCPERRVTVRRSASERTMTHPIPGADSEPLYSSAKERADFEAEYRANWGFQFSKDVLGCYEDYTMERDFQEWLRTPRAAAKVGANVADANDVCQLPPADWYCTRKAGHDGPCAVIQHEPDRELDAGDREAIARGMARLTAGAPAETPKQDHDFDRVMTLRDAYHDIADKLAEAIAEHLGINIGEHSSDNRPWLNALNAIAAQPAPIAGDVEKDALAKAYGYLWHINAASGAPAECEVMSLSPERAAYEARKALRDLLTHEQRGKGIEAARAAMLANSSSGEAG